MADYNPYAAPQEAPPLPQALVATGTPQPWSVGEVISLGWTRFTQSWAILVFSYLVVAIILQVVAQIAQRALGMTPDFQSRGYWIAFGGSLVVNQIVNAYFQTGLLRIWLGVARGQAPSFGVLFSGFDRFLPMLALTLLMTLASGLGLVLLIVPGILIYLGLYLAPYYLVDAGMGPIEAMKASWNATRGQKADVFLLVLAGVGLGMLGFVMCLLGILATYPLYAVAAAVAYTRMSGVGVVASAYGDGAPGYGSPTG